MCQCKDQFTFPEAYGNVILLGQTRREESTVSIPRAHGEVVAIRSAEEY